MADDFVKTAQQMMSDARALRNAGAHRNACYLAGYVAECTLKAMLLAAGTTPKTVHDLQSLEGALKGLSLTPSHTIGKYGNPSRHAPTMFRKSSTECDWHPKHRYDGSRWANDATSYAYVNEAQKFIQILNQMILDRAVK